MCNAHNHPPGCQCGWGGGWYSGGYGRGGSWLGSSSSWRGSYFGDSAVTNRTKAEIQALPIANVFALGNGPSRTVVAGGWVAPNARCPVCGAEVYFYRSPDGGKVYFDELGPPWPKHACTVVASPTQTEQTAPRQAENHEGDHLRWDARGWNALAEISVGPVGSRGHIRIQGTHGGRYRAFICRAPRPIRCLLVRFRELNLQTVEVSVLTREGQGAEWQVYEGTAGNNQVPLDNSPLELMDSFRQVFPDDGAEQEQDRKPPPPSAPAIDFVKTLDAKILTLLEALSDLRTQRDEALEKMAHRADADTATLDAGIANAQTAVRVLEDALPWANSAEARAMISALIESHQRHLRRLLYAACASQDADRPSF